MTAAERYSLLAELLIERFGAVAGIVNERPRTPAQDLGGVADRSHGRTAVASPSKSERTGSPAKDAGPLDTTTHER